MRSETYSFEHVMKSKQQMIMEVSEGQNEEKKQDLVDELLAEFGL